VQYIETSPHPEVIRYLRQRHRQRARRWAAREAQPHKSKTEDIAHEHFVPAPSHEAGALDEHRAAEYRRVRSAMLAAEQSAILALRDSGHSNSAIADASDGLILIALTSGVAYNAPLTRERREWVRITDARTST
jgi:hypothetical protein